MDIVRLMFLSRQMKNIRHEKDNMVTGIPPLTFTAKKTGTLKNYRIYGNTVDGESVGNLVTDSKSEHYGEYAIPITNNSEIANIYLNEPLRMVGDEAEYIDYGEQKQHRVRKNLLKNTYASAGATTYDGVSISNNDGILTLNGTSNNGSFVNLAKAIKLSVGNYILTGGSENLMLRFQKNSTGYGYDDTGTGRNIVCLEKVTSGVCNIKFTANYTYNNIRVYPMIRKADIEDDTYEPYIADTELDVILPGIAVTAGTNTFTVGTEVQPSRVELTGRIKEAQTNGSGNT